jgi:hypothetical protein
VRVDLHTVFTSSASGLHKALYAWVARWKPAGSTGIGYVPMRDRHSTTLSGPAGLFHLTSNRIRNNTKACAAGEDIPFPLSGCWRRAGDLSGVWRWF